MRVLYKITLVLTAVILSLHHVCNWNRCSRDLQQICYYTTPSTWDEILASKSEFYHDNIHYVYLDIQDQYERYVEPIVTEASSRLNERLTRPAIKLFSRIDYEEIERVGKVGCEYLTRFGQRAQFYFNVYCRPYLWQAKEKVGNSEFLGGITARGKEAISPLAEKLIQLKETLTARLRWRLTQPIGEEEESGTTRSVLSTDFSITSSILRTPSPTPFFATEGDESNEVADDNVEIESRSLGATIEEEKEKEKDEETETETMTITITQTAVVTPSSVAYAVSTSLIGTMEENVSHEGELTKRFAAEMGSQSTVVDIIDAYMSEEELLQKDFENWSVTINKKAKSIIKLFDKEVDRTISKILKEYNDDLAVKIKEYSQVAKEHFKKIMKATEDIDCREEIDPDTGRKVYFNKEGTSELEQYVHRQLMRDYFSSYSNQTSAILDEINDRLESLTDKVNASVERLRDEFIDVYEEWGNVMVNEWTKRLAYVDVLAANLKENQDNHLSEENWKNFIEIKKSVIDARDTLINHSAPLSDVAKFIKKVQGTLSMLTSENGEYAYILRAKANLAFQKREKEERERARSMQLEEERRSKEEEEEKRQKATEVQEEVSAETEGEIVEPSLEQDITKDQQPEIEQTPDASKTEEPTLDYAEVPGVGSTEEGGSEMKVADENVEDVDASEEEEQDSNEPISTIKITRTRSVTRTRH